VAGLTATTTAVAQGFQSALARMGYDSFRPGQLESLETLFHRGRIVLVAPTGGGKSLIYQLPATLLDGTTLVISPLIALMQDQCEALAARGVSATYLASTLSWDEIDARIEGIRERRYRLVYVAPERLPHPGFRRVLDRLTVPLVAIDEAHCISQWGHDFRPEYREIGAFLKSIPGCMVLACTATATPIVRDDIVAQLGLGADTPQIVRGFARPNLSLRVRNLSTAAQRSAAIDETLEEALGRVAGLGRMAEGSGAAIVYCLSRKDAEEEAKRLRAEGWSAGWYHAGLSGDHRAEVQRRFMSGHLQVVAATNAFGMGIDRADVRAVIHMSPPDSVESYYQEVGRAGRDGKEALGVLLLRASDIPRRKVLIERGGEGEISRAWVEHKWSMFQDLLRWADGGTCRHDAILRYFGDEAETLHGCGRCDVCRQLSDGGAGETEDAEPIARAALAAVALVDQRLGFKAAVKLLRGEEDERLTRYGLSSATAFGTLASRSEAWVSLLLQRCVSAGWVDFTQGEYQLLLLTAAGRAVLDGKRPARLMLPSIDVGRKERGAKSGRVRERAGAARAATPGKEPLESPEYAVRFERLRRWRLETSRLGSVPAFVVASDRTLQDIASTNPRNLDELRLCYGIGDRKVELYGEEILAALRSA
jgi:ATP-dependent DNA helicase RecQ